MPGTSDKLSPTATVTVVVPARDAAATLPALLAALAAQDCREPYEVIVVDDGSTDATAAIAERHGAVTRVLALDGRGPSAARNAGAAIAGGNVLAFTDADCVPAPDWLTAGLAALANAGLVQGRVVTDPVARPGPFDRFVAVAGLTHLYETANLFVMRAEFDAVGGFEGWLLPGFSKELGEDVWLGWRLRRAGVRVAYSSEAVVAHAVFPRGPAGYVAERARLRFFPAMARRIPELRDVFFHRRVFLNSRTALFDLAVCGAALGVARRRPAYALATLPYARRVARDARAWGTGSAPAVAAAQVSADAVGFVALVYGSVRARSPLF